MRPLCLLAAALCAVVAASIFLFAEEKLGAVFGRLDYRQFWLAIASAAAAILLALPAFLPSPMVRPFLFRTLAVAGSGLACLAVVEAACWRLPARHVMDNPWYAMDGGQVQATEQLPWIRPPHLYWKGTSRGDIARLCGDPDPYAEEVVFQTDYQGFRNSQDLKQADVVFIGDSFTEAGNIPEEQTFVHRVGRDLNVSVRNLGRAGYTGPTELIVLREFGLPCKPKLVVWQVCEANDLDECLLYQDWVRRGRPKDYYVSTDDPYSTPLMLWRGRSPTYRIFSWFRRRNWDFTGAFTDEHGGEHTIYFLRKFGTGQSPAEHDGWPILQSSLNDAAQLLREQGIPWIVLYIPMKTRILAERVSFTPQTQREMRGWGTPRSLLEDYVAQFCREQVVPFCTTTPALMQATRRGKLVYLPMDTHLSALGHEVVAETLAPFLQEHWREP